MKKVPRVKSGQPSSVDWHDRIDATIKANFDRIVALRRHLHAHPEPSHEELATSLHLYQQFSEMELPVRMGPEGRGVIVDSRDDGEVPHSRRLALRADCDALRKAIIADRTINEQVRQQALEWSALFWKAYSEPLSRKLNAQSWKIVKEPKLSSEKYQAALKMSVKANALIPNSGAVLNTLGVAQYRAKKYQDALITLNRSAKLNAAQFGSDSLYDLVFVAMTHFQLDAKQKATELLGKVKLSAKNAKNNDAELDGFIKEAEMIILPGPKETE